MSYFRKNLPACLSLAVHPKVLALTAVPTSIGLLIDVAVKLPKIITTAKKIKSEVNTFVETYMQNMASDNEIPIVENNEEVYNNEESEDP